MKKNSLLLLSTVLISLSFSACGGGGGGSTADEGSSTMSVEPQVQTGIFADSVVEGLRFKTISQAGYTNEKGEYHFHDGEDIEFFIGDYSLGKVKATSLMSPYSLEPDNANTAIKIAQLLQTLDSVGTTADGITIEDFKNFTALDNAPLLTDPDFQTEVQVLLSKALVSADTAKEHLDNTLHPTQITSTNAFDIYDDTSFASSICTPLAIEQPVGVFASPTGTPQGSGTQNDPLDLATALQNNNKVQDGDTLWLMEGVYVGSFTSELRGSENNPIKVKPYPGKHVKIDTTYSTGSGLLINGSWTHYYGIEVTSYDGGRVSTIDNSSNPSDITLNAGVNIIGSTNKVINFVSHDNASGIDAWSKRKDGFTGIDTETYGSIIYNNGWSAQPADGSYGRGHGHAIYTQNFDGIKKITNNVIFYGFGTGIHAYQTGKTVQNGVLRGLENFDIQDNTWFLTGASDIRRGMKKYDCLVGGYQPIKNLIMKNNQGYSDLGKTVIGWASNYKDVPFNNEGAQLENNYLAQKLEVRVNWNQNSVLMKNNSSRGSSINQAHVNDLGGNDFSSSPTTGKKIFYVKNTYDKRRGRVTIYNYDRDASVAVDLSKIMKVGSAYRVHSVFDLFGAPIINGVYTGGNVDIPMGTVLPPQPYGLEGAINTSEGDDPKELFGVFIITHGGC